MSGNKRQSLSLEKKAAIIAAVDTAPPSKKKKDIATDFGILPNTLSTILKNRSAIMANQQQQSIAANRKRFRSPKYPEVEEALLKWFKTKRDKNVPILGPLLMTKAKSFAEMLGKEDFDASQGWLTRFKERHDIMFKSVCGESASVSQDVMDHWLTQILPGLIEGYTPSNIFNADETGLFWRLLPDKTLAFKGDKCHGGKLSKERITLVVGANMDGTEKLPLLAIGKFAKLQCFKGVQILPILYEANRKAWIVSDLFQQWIKKLDAKFHRQGRQVILFVDNCPAHPMVESLQSIKVVFLPPNTTSELQPCDMGIIKNLKVKYLGKILCKCIDAIDSGQDTSINLLDALHMIRAAWSEVTGATIANCFKKAGFSICNEEEEAIEDMETAEEIGLSALWMRSGSDISVEDFLSVDYAVETSGDLTDYDIVDEVQSKFGGGSTSKAEDNEEDDCGEEFQRPSSKEAQAAIETLRHYFYGAEYCNDESIFRRVDEIERSLKVVVSKSQKQSTIKDYFNTLDNSN